LAGGFNGEIFNVNADQMAIACAGAFGADSLVFFTDVEGVLDGEGRLLPSLTASAAEKLIADGIAKGGMEAKLRAAISAVSGGVGQVRIVAGSTPGVVAGVVAGKALGTTITA
jgi:acetylglutamate kinase